ncbi:MAG: hypothetical protein ACR2HR_08210 [Euzebya sp.]
MLLWSYLIYVVIAIGLTVWLASTLFRNGALFLDDVFIDRPEMAQAVNRLLVVGFYMLNLGWAFLIIRADEPVSAANAVEILATKVGQLLFTLGVIHFFNLYVFSRIRKGRRNEQVPPVHSMMVPGVPAFAGFGGGPPVSADGNYRWDGHEWVAAQEQAFSPPSGPQQPR